MSEMTAARNGLPRWAVATIALVVLGWLASAWYLWRTQVPGDLNLPNLSAQEFFDAKLL